MGAAPGGGARRAFGRAALRAAPGEVVLELRAGQHDLVFEVREGGRGGRPALLLLVEHQRRQQAGFVRRAARGAARLADAWLRDRGWTPAVLPLLVHQARRPWSAPLRLADTEATPPALRRRLGQRCLGLQVTALDLGRRTPGRLVELPGPSVVGPTLALLRGAADGPDGALRVLERLAPRFRVLRRTPDGRRDLALLVDYTAYTSRSVPGADRRLVAALGPAARDAMKTPGEILFRAKLEERAAEAKAEARAEFVVALLEARFGELPAATRSRVQASSEEELLRVASAAPTARRLEDLLPTRSGRRGPRRRSGSR